MRNILAGVTSLVQHVQEIKTHPRLYRPESCIYCGNQSLWGHGSYLRKADRQISSEEREDPVAILRFYCPRCKRTCSVLPECIPPYRWHLWALQKAVLLLYLSGKSLKQIADECIATRWTIKRWWDRLVTKFTVHSFHLKSIDVCLGYADDVKDFWRQCLDKFDLSKIMLTLNNLGEIIP